MPKPTFLVISQVYVPDPASVGQHVADAAAEMARRGYRVIVYASARGYDDPTKKYPSRETLHGVDVRRLPLSSLGKSSNAVRLVAQWIFLIQAMVRGVFTRNLVGIMVSTSPPFCGFAGAFISKLRGVPVKYWLMDLNPDQMVAMGKLKETSLPVKIFDWFNRTILRQASEIVMLDRFMLERVNKKGVEVARKTAIMPPWPHEDELAKIAHADNPFRKKQGLDGKFVIMYSGNHSPANPIKTILDAAERFQGDERLVFMCIGGGGGKKEVEEKVAKGIKNIRSLPYQPLSEIKYSLSSADVHIVSVGPGVVGIVHPCKVYGAMAVSRPILLLGPNPCHVSDLIEKHKIGWHIAHGDVDGAERVIKQILATPREELAAMGERAAEVIRTQLSKDILQTKFCDVLQKDLPVPARG
jgi:colanic acid biosynthesis glycosyl transferase WcaI